MLKSYEATINNGELQWIDQVPPMHQEMRAMVIVEEMVQKPSPPQENNPNQQDAMLIEQYKDKLTPEQIAFFSKWMGAWSLTDSATISPYDYPKL